MRHYTHVHEALSTREWVITHTWMSHKYKWIQLDGLSPTPHRIITQTRRVMCYKRMRTNMSHCATLMHESRHKYERASSHTWTNHTRERIMSSDGTHINESHLHSCLVWIVEDMLRSLSFVVGQCMYMNESWRIYRWKIPVKKMRLTYLHMHVIFGRLVCPTQEWVMPHEKKRHVANMNASCHPRDCHEYGRDAWDVRMRRVTRVGGASHTRKCSMSHTWMGHATRMDENWHTHRWVVSHV